MKHEIKHSVTPHDLDKVASDFSDHVLNIIKKSLLSKILNLTIPPKNIDYADFTLDKTELDKTAAKIGGEDTPVTINLHVNFNENKYGINKNGNLQFRIRQKKKAESRKPNTLIFKHKRAELRLINSNSYEIRFLERNAHDVNDFAAKFAIHIISELRPILPLF